MNNGNLVDYLKKNPSAPRTVFVRLSHPFPSFMKLIITLKVYDIVAGLEYLHEQSLIHRDIKGVNFIFSRCTRV